MYKIAEPRIIQCPFDRSHIINSLRIQRHIIKCQKNHPEVKFISCVFNFTHKIKPSEILEHYKACPYKTETCYSHLGETNKRFDDSFEVVNPDIMYFLPKNRKGSGSSLSLSSSESFNSKFEAISLDNSFTDDDEELKPLPLPKTPSKAFTFRKTNEKEMDKSHQIPKADSFSSLSSSSWIKYRRKNEESTPKSSKKKNHSSDDDSKELDLKKTSSCSSFSELGYATQATENDFDDEIPEDSEVSEDSSSDDSFYLHHLKSRVKK